MTLSNPSALAYCFEKYVVRMRHRLGQVHVAAAADINHRVARDDAFFEPASAITGLIVEQGSNPAEKTIF